MPKRPCLQCGALTDENSYCEAHQKPPYMGLTRKAPWDIRHSADNRKRNTTKRGYGWEWQKVRLFVLARDGYVCQIKGPRCTGRADTVDHVLPLAEHGPTYDPALLRAACWVCNYGHQNRRA